MQEFRPQLFHHEQVTAYCKVKGTNGIFQNFHPSELTVNDLTFGSGESLYQALKFRNAAIQEEIALATNPKLAKNISYFHQRHWHYEPWDLYSVLAMKAVLWARYEQDTAFAKAILALTKLPLEISYKDSFWGAKPTNDQRYYGCNVLGILQGQLWQYVKNDKDALTPASLRNLPFIVNGSSITFGNTPY